MLEHIDDSDYSFRISRILFHTPVTSVIEPSIADIHAVGRDIIGLLILDVVIIADPPAKVPDVIEIMLIMLYAF